METFTTGAEEDHVKVDPSWSLHQLGAHPGLQLRKRGDLERNTRLSRVELPVVEAVGRGASGHTADATNTTDATSTTAEGTIDWNGCPTRRW